MHTFLVILKTILVAAIVLLVGLLGLSMFFADLGPGETLTSRLTQAALLFFLSGALIGYLHNRTWMLAGLVAWGPVLLSLVRLPSAVIGGIPVSGLAELFAFLLLPLGLALAGGYLGALLANRRVFSRVWMRLFGDRKVR